MAACMSGYIKEPGAVFTTLHFLLTYEWAK
jgi:hypothetical protein